MPKNKKTSVKKPKIKAAPKGKSKKALPPFLLEKIEAANEKPARKKAKPAVAKSSQKPAAKPPATPVDSPQSTVDYPPTSEVEALPRFDELGLPEPVARAVAALGFETPTPIQARAVPILLAGHDLIGQAQTGTGKTAAFALPLVAKMDASRRETQALVLAPTPELAVQVAGGIYDLAKFTGLRVVPVYGGQPIDRQLRALQGGAQIVVGTPGRVQDHLRRGSLSLENVSFCVLDEADEMLAMGFYEDIEAILGELPEERQTAFFSATIPPRIGDLMKRFLREPQRVAIEAQQRTLETTNQAYYEVAPGKKLDALARILDMETPGPTIVFCRTRQETQDLSEALRLRGYGADAIHGDMNQGERERVLKRFRDGQSELLIATDVAARGLDIEHVTHVINYNIPFDVEQYIHRIGRTGRAGRSGDAITLIEGRERRQLKFLERMIGATIKPVRLPTAADIAARRREVFKESLRAALEAEEFDGHMATVEELCEEFDATSIAAAALHLLWQSQHSGQAEVAEEIAVEGEHPEAGMTRLFVGMGRQDGLRPADLVGAIAHGADIPGKSIGAIDILDRTAFVEVPSSETYNVLDALRRCKLRGRKVRVDVATPKGGGR